MSHRNPLMRMFSPANVLTPIAIDRWLYLIPDGSRVVEYKYLYFFGIRIARWNS